MAVMSVNQETVSMKEVLQVAETGSAFSLAHNKNYGIYVHLVLECYLGIFMC